MSDKYTNPKYVDQYDVKIRSSDGYEIPAVKTILKMVSPVFNAVFSDNKNETVIDVDFEADAIFHTLELTYGVLMGQEIHWKIAEKMTVVDICPIVFKYEFANLNEPIKRSMFHSFEIIGDCEYRNPTTMFEKVLKYIYENPQDKVFAKNFGNSIRAHIIDSRFDSKLHSFILVFQKIFPIQSQMESLDKLQISADILPKTNKQYWKNMIDDIITYQIKNEKPLSRPFQRYLFEQSYTDGHLNMNYLRLVEKAELGNEFIKYQDD